MAIYVTKTWADSIGNVADLFLTEDDVKGVYAIVLASPKNLDASAPFVYAEAVRHPATQTENREPFIAVWIPVGEVAAIFDLTDADSKKMGFTT